VRALESLGWLRIAGHEMPADTAVSPTRPYYVFILKFRVVASTVPHKTAVGHAVNICRADRIGAAALQHSSLRPQFLAFSDTCHLDGKI